MSSQAADIQRELAQRNADDLAVLVAQALVDYDAVGSVQVIPAEPGQPVAVGVEYAGESWFLEVQQ